MTASGRPDEAADGDRQAPRIPIPAVDEMTPVQREIHDRAVAYLGAPIGPRMALLSTPEVAQQWARLLDTLGRSALSRRLWELTVLFVARQWHAQFAWWAHASKAIAEGLSPAVVEAIRTGRAPQFEREDEAAVYAYLVELYRDRDVSDATYERLRSLLGTRLVVELTVLAGHYGSVAMTLVAHRVALPDGVEAPLPTIVASDLSPE